MAVSKHLPMEEKKKRAGVSAQAIVAALPGVCWRQTSEQMVVISCLMVTLIQPVRSQILSRSPAKVTVVPSFQNGLPTTPNGSTVITVGAIEDEEELSAPKKSPVPVGPMIVEIDDSPPPSRPDPFLRPLEVVEPGKAPQLQTTGLNCASSTSP